ncbi:hypothetical protein FNV43_RR22608 [Rhamnella rubrinervis]|uniref:Uncharacterized protein n=1 Tax=Rhamnella rubrinervis TaxID=2594499 RepID=A0A8K0GR98_9ROSA|nr:hypothetical protein FNV43_RR22608 [Rhamnella rubrinervis]
MSTALISNIAPQLAPKPHHITLAKPEKPKRNHKSSLRRARALTLFSSYLITLNVQNGDLGVGSGAFFIHRFPAAASQAQPITPESNLIDSRLNLRSCPANPRSYPAVPRRFSPGL